MIVLIVVGSFLILDNLLFELLVDLVKYIRKDKLDVVILVLFVYVCNNKIINFIKVLFEVCIV